MAPPNLYAQSNPSIHAGVQQPQTTAIPLRRVKGSVVNAADQGHHGLNQSAQRIPAHAPLPVAARIPPPTTSNTSGSSSSVVPLSQQPVMPTTAPSPVPPQTTASVTSRPAPPFQQRSSQTNLSINTSISNSGIPLPPQSPSPTPPLKPLPVVSQRRSTKLVLIAIWVTICFVATAWFAQATFSSTSFSVYRNFFKKTLKVDIGDTLTILALMSGILTFFSGILLDTVLEIVQWALVCQDEGVPLSSVLAISGTTGSMGTIGIVRDKGLEPAARWWAVLKLTLRFFIWAAGVTLFLKTSVETVYKSSFSYQAIAGIGPFDGSYVDSFRKSLRFRNLNMTDDVVPYSALSVAHNIIVSAQHSVNSDHNGCDDDLCDSYILPGGLFNSWPMPPTNLPDDPVILLESVPSYRLDFQRDVYEPMAHADCDLYYQHPWMIAIRFCVAPSQINQGSVHVSLQVCDNGTSGNTCLSKSTAPPSMNTTLSLYALTTSMVVSRSNQTILSLLDASDAVPDRSLNISAYRSSLRWLLNYTASDIPAPSSAVEYFWSGKDELASNYWAVGPREAFQSVLAYPLWFFNVNNGGNVARSDATTTFTPPAEYYTTASVASPSTKIVVNTTMFAIFVILQSTVLLTAWTLAVTLWCKSISLPTISSYPIFCFAFKMVAAPLTPNPAPTPTAATTTAAIAVTAATTTTPPASGARSTGQPGTTTHPLTPGPLFPSHTLFNATDISHADDAAIRAAIAGHRVKFPAAIAPAPTLGVWLRVSLLSLPWRRRRHGKAGPGGGSSTTTSAGP